MKKFFYILSAVSLLMGSCKKADFADDKPTGEGLVGFTLGTPTSSSSIALNSATPNTVIPFSWGASKPGLYEQPTYKLVFALKSAGNLENPVMSFDAAGATSLNITYAQFDAALATAGVASGAVAELIWSVRANNGDADILASNIFMLNVRRFSDGASPFQILGPASTLNSISINPSSTGTSFKFNWTRSRPGAGGAPVKYKVLFVERKLDAEGKELTPDFTNPLFTITSDNAGADSIATVSYKQLSDSMYDAGFTNLPLPVNLTWTVVATSGTWTQRSDYYNNFVVIREVRVYMVGGATPIGWTVENAIRMIPDASNFGVFYTYVRLTGGQEFKFINMQAWPPAPGAVDWGQAGGGAAGDLTADGENNIPISTTGDYRVTVDLNNMKYYVQEGRMGAVGGATAAGWDPPGVFPAQAFGLTKTNHFLGLVDLTNGQEWKMIDNNAWPSGGGPVSQTRDYGRDANNAGVLLEAGEQNFAASAGGRHRIIWDGTDPLSLKYQIMPATEMRVVGNAIDGVPDWNPGASPQMTYAGNGIWTITVSLKADKEYKFLSGNDWGAFDYEDASGGVNTVGTTISTIYNGNSNFKSPAVAGTYTITLNEKAGTVTVTN